MIAPTPQTAQPKAPHAHPSWSVLAAGLFAVHAAIGGLSNKSPTDLFWLATPVAQVGIFAALALAVIVPALSFFRAFFARLRHLGDEAPPTVLLTCLALGLIARLGTDAGRFLSGAPSYRSSFDFMVQFPVAVIATALIFLLTARLMALKAARAPETPNG